MQQRCDTPTTYCVYSIECDNAQPNTKHILYRAKRHPLTQHIYSRECDTHTPSALYIRGYAEQYPTPTHIYKGGRRMLYKPIPTNTPK